MVSKCIQYRGICSVADTGAIQQRSMANSCQKGWNGSTGNHKVTQDLTTKSTHGTRQLKRCCFHRIAEGSRPREVWADTSATARRYLGEWTNGKDQFCCTDPKFFLVHELSSQQFKAGLSSKKTCKSAGKLLCGFLHLCESILACSLVLSCTCLKAWVILKHPNTCAHELK